MVSRAQTLIKIGDHVSSLMADSQATSEKYAHTNDTIWSFIRWPFQANTWENQAQDFVYQRNVIIPKLNLYTYQAATFLVGTKVWLRLIAMAK